METLNCPKCGAVLDGEIINGRIKCEYCKSIVIVSGVGDEVRDVNTGMIIAKASCPKGYILGGALDQNVQSSAYPLTTLVWCENADKSVRFFRESGKCFQHIIKHPLIKHIEGQMESNYLIPMAKFKTVEQYLDDLAFNMMPDKKVKHLKDIDLLPVPQIDDSIPPAIQAEIDCQAMDLSYGIDTRYGKAISRLYEIGDEYLLLGAPLFGVKWFVNAPMMPFGFGSFGGFDFGGLFGKKKEVEEEPQDPVIKSMQSPSEGKAGTITNWWIPAIYGMVTKKMPDEKSLRDFSIFSTTVIESDQVLQTRYGKMQQFINNIYAAREQERMNVNNYVANAQADIHRRQNQISQSIQQRSNIINSTYANRVASQDRMRKQTSEAIRGVDTYNTSHGPTEFKTGAKRVIEKNNDPKNMVEIGYLDTVPDGWTEIFKS